MESSRLLSGTALLWLASAFFLSETARVGGSGGNRTVTMDCGSGAFIVGATASGGRDGGFGFNLVRKIKFTCRKFDGTTPTGSTTQTAEAVADHAASLNFSSSSRDCTSGLVMHSLELYAGTFIDRLTTGACMDAGSSVSYLDYNVGGEGGGRAFLACASTEGLYKVEARVGDAIDSMKGYCRPFAAPPPPSVPSQILASPTPKPTPSNPLVVPLSASKTISFRITDAGAAYSTASVGVTAETDLLGGGGLNPPDFTLELLNPSGTVVASKGFVNPRGIAEVGYHFNVNGTWKLRIANRKKDVGFLNITDFSAHA